MSLLLILRKIWNYKLVTLPIFACVLALAYYVVAVTDSTYEASGTYILVNPPPPPTEADIARDPSLELSGTDNPYLRFDGSVLAQVLSSRLNSEEVRASLTKQGADPNYVAAPSAEFGFSAPILQITGTGTSPAAAINTTNLVGRTLARELKQMQEIRRVNPAYRIKTEAVVAAHDATLKASGKLRSLVAVCVLGVVLLFIAISVLDAISALRTEWGIKRSIQTPSGPHVPADGAEGFPERDPQAEPWPVEARR